MNTDFTVMFLDDDAYVLNAYQRIVRGESFRCVFEQDCQHAAAYLAKNPVDLLLVDYQMPAQNGLEFCKSKANWHQQPACYLLSGTHASPLFDEALYRGLIQGLLHKPITKIELLAFIQQQQRMHAD